MLSWPDSRTGVPSRTSEPNASASAVAQSMGEASVITLRRRSSMGTSLGWTLKPEGTVPMRSAARASLSTGTAVSGEASGGLRLKPVHGPRGS